MSTVISLSDYRAARKAPASADSTTPVSLDIDFDDVQRIHPVREDGTPVLTLDNQVLLGPRARGQVRALFWHYGLRQMPTTWGELEGNWNYCRLLSLALISMTPEESPGVLKGLRTRHNRREPGRGDLLWMLMKGDIDGAYAWHRTHEIFQRNACDPKLAPNKAASATASAA